LKINSNYEYNIKETIFYKKIISYFKYIEEHFYVDNDINKFYILLLLFEIGKKYIKGNKDKYIFTIEEFICEGFSRYKDNSYTNIYKHFLNKLLSGDNIDDCIIYKDATASGLQNFGILYGYNVEHLNFINLDGNC